MNNAKGIVMARLHSIDANIANIRVIVTALLSSLALAACGGGAQTTENPVTSAAPTGGYNGPVAANAEVRKFQDELWVNIESSSRCGGCHSVSGGIAPMFARHDNINLAYDAAVSKVTLSSPQDSEMVLQVGSGHNCWVGTDAASNAVCASNMTSWIENWAGNVIGSGGRTIELVPPVPMEPGESRSYADADINLWESEVYTPYLALHCDGCHTSSSPTQQSPYFAEPNVPSAYEAAKPKMNLDDPAASRLVVKLRMEGHNCWSGASGCDSDADELAAAIARFANFDPRPLDPALVNSKAMTILNGTVASGGNRYEADQIALYEFKEGTGSIAHDTSAVEPALDLNLSGDVDWFGGWGITINDGKAQGSTTASAKLHDMIRLSGAYSIEAWVIPNNVTQEMARIVSYSAGDTARNFTLQQTLYDYEFQNRSTLTSLNGVPEVSTPADADVLQATLQHVVATYSEISGRQIWVNGQMVSEADPTPGGSMVDWQDTFAFVLGSEVSGDGLWQGTLRLVAIHDRVLDQSQITQNFDAGVGEKFYLLFGIEDVINVPQTYILFEVAQFDSYGYLFNKPHFIELAGGSVPAGIDIQGMRIGLNGREVDVGQSYANITDTFDAALFEELGQPLSDIGAVIPLEYGPDFDEFFLTFELLGGESNVFVDDPRLIVFESDLPPSELFGVRTFDEINATMAEITTVDPQNQAVDFTFQSLRQSLPAVESPEAFLSSHQVAIAQMAIEYCNALVNDTGKRTQFFQGFTAWNAAPGSAFTPANRALIVQPLIERTAGIAVLTQPDYVDVELELSTVGPIGGHPGNLIDRLINSPDNPNTESIVKGVCAAAIGSAMATVQ